jgi:hypothetical protein
VEGQNFTVTYALSRRYGIRRDLERSQTRSAAMHLSGMHRRREISDTSNAAQLKNLMRNGLCRA